MRMAPTLPSLALRSAGIVCLLAAPAVAAHAQRSNVGTLTVTRQVDVTPGTLAEAPRYIAARPNQVVFIGQGVRTLKRSLAEINFYDRSALRINERTDLVVQESATLRRIGLTAGAVWVRVAKGVHTQVETPTVTAAAKGTEFVVALIPDDTEKTGRSSGPPPMRTQVVVFEGVVEVRAGNRTIDVSAGQALDIDASGVVGEPRRLPQNELPSEYGGRAISWWSQIGGGKDVRVTAGTRAEDSLRESPLTEIATLAATTIPGGSVGGGTVGGVIRSRATSSRAVDDVLSSNPQLAELGQIDRTRTSYAALAAGVVASLALDRNRLHPGEYEARGTVYGLTNLPAIVGGRGEFGVTVGLSRYSLESNVRLLSDDRGDRWVNRLDSVAFVERPIGRDLRVFAGRRRFYNGPVFNNLIQTQLLADRYSGAGARYSHGPLTAEAAWLYDASADFRGAQNGALGSVSYNALGGTFGVHALHQSGPDSGASATVSLSLPIWLNKIDGYGEVGRGADRRAVQTVGLYFPTLFQRTDLDIFVEYAHHQGLGRSLSVIVAKENAQGLGGRLYANHDGHGVSGGVSAIMRFGVRGGQPTRQSVSANP